MRRCNGPGKTVSRPMALISICCLVRRMLSPLNMWPPFLQTVLPKNWDWNNTWGWDYPMFAMTAARLGEG